MKPYLRSVVLAAAVVALSTAGFSADGSSLKPPAGAKVAIVMFEDLECPECARAYPVVWEVARAHNVPVVLHDFPLPKHSWSFDAAVYARFFDTKSQKMGDDFRGYIFQNQPQITRENLLQYVQKFANDNRVPLPFTVDPAGKLKALVQADYELGQRIGLQHTPTIFVIGDGGPSTPAVEVADRSQLSQIVEEMQRKVAPATPPRPVTNRSHKKG